MPLIAVEVLVHNFPLLGMDLGVSGKHKVQAIFAHHVSESFGPDHIKFLFAIQDVLLGSCIGGEIDAIRDTCRRIPVVVVIATKVLHDAGILGWNGHGILLIVNTGQKKRSRGLTWADMLSGLKWLGNARRHNL